MSLTRRILDELFEVMAKKRIRSSRTKPQREIMVIGYLDPEDLSIRGDIINLEYGSDMHHSGVGHSKRWRYRSTDQVVFMHEPFKGKEKNSIKFWLKKRGYAVSKYYLVGEAFELGLI